MPGRISPPISARWPAGSRRCCRPASITRPSFSRAPPGSIFGNRCCAEWLGSAAPPGWARRRRWHTGARRVVLATGALERSLVFGGNDRPGGMLASAVETYVNRYAVLPGSRAVLFADNDDAYHAAAALTRAGV